MTAAATEQRPQTISDTYPTTLEIDGREVRFQVKRLDLGEWTAFDRDFERVGRIHKRGQYRLDRHRQVVIDPVTREPKKRALPLPPVEDGQIQTERVGDFEVILETDVEVQARLDDEETEEQRAVRDKRDREEDTFAVGLVQRSITSYVTCDAGQLFAGSTPIVSGADLLKHYGARQDIVQPLFREIYIQNAFSEDAKKKLASRRASSDGSSASNPPAPGAEPAPTADDASPKGSVTRAPATE